MNDNGIWSDSALCRLRSVRRHKRTAAQISRTLADSAPSGHWPFGMPTSVNPWLLVIGISPGHGEHSNEDSYPAPTFGSVHSGFGGEFADPHNPWDGAYWQKTRELCIGIIQKNGPGIESAADCLALSGHLNLGTKNEGRGTFEATNRKIIDWIPTALEILKPRVVILFGWKSLIGNLSKRWDVSHPLGFLVNSNAEQTISFKGDSQRAYSFSIWQLKSSWGKITTICWPNHPSKPPFNRKNNWRIAVKQAANAVSKSLSASVADNKPQLESPAWHEDVLRDREAKIKSGKETFMDWEIAKKQLRDSVR